MVNFLVIFLKFREFLFKKLKREILLSKSFMIELENNIEKTNIGNSESATNEHFSSANKNENNTSLEESNIVIEVNTPVMTKIEEGLLADQSFERFDGISEEFDYPRFGPEYYERLEKFVEKTKQNLKEPRFLEERKENYAAKILEKIFPSSTYFDVLSEDAFDIIIIAMFSQKQKALSSEILSRFLCAYYLHMNETFLLPSEVLRIFEKLSQKELRILKEKLPYPKKGFRKMIADLKRRYKNAQKSVIRQFQFKIFHTQVNSKILSSSNASVAQESDLVLRLKKRVAILQKKKATAKTRARLDKKFVAQFFSQEVLRVFERSCILASKHFMTPVITVDILFLALFETPKIKGNKILKRSFLTDYDEEVFKYFLVTRIFDQKKEVEAGLYTFSKPSRNIYYYFFKSRQPEWEIKRLTNMGNILKKKIEELRYFFVTSLPFFNSSNVNNVTYLKEEIGKEIREKMW